MLLFAVNFLDRLPLPCELSMAMKTTFREKLQKLIDCLLEFELEEVLTLCIALSQSLVDAGRIYFPENLIDLPLSSN